MQSDSTTNLTSVLTSVGIAGGLIYSIAKKKKFIGVFGYALGFGIAGLIIGIGVDQAIAQN